MRCTPQSQSVRVWKANGRRRTPTHTVGGARHIELFTWRYVPNMALPPVSPERAALYGWKPFTPVAKKFLAHFWAPPNRLALALCSCSHRKIWNMWCVVLCVCVWGGRTSERRVKGGVTIEPNCTRKNHPWAYARHNVNVRHPCPRWSHQQQHASCWRWRRSSVLGERTRKVHKQQFRQPPTWEWHCGTAGCLDTAKVAIPPTWHVDSQPQPTTAKTNTVLSSKTHSGPECSPTRPQPSEPVQQHETTWFGSFECTILVVLTMSVL